MYGLSERDLAGEKWAENKQDRLHWFQSMHRTGSCWHCDKRHSDPIHLEEGGRPLKQVEEASRVERLEAQIQGLMNSLAKSQQEVERLRKTMEKWAWHRDGNGPDVPVLQERYDRLRSELDTLRANQAAAAQDVWDKVIAIPAQWADSYKSCREHFDNPCCHVRLATTIVEALEAARQDGAKGKEDENE